MESAATLTIRSRCLAAAAAPALGAHRRGTLAAPRLGRRWAPCSRLRALPPELSEILSPKLVPGSPADTGDVSSLIPISAVMLLFYFVSNWVFPELIMKGMQQPVAEDEAAADASMPRQQQGGAIDGSGSKIRLKVKKKKKSVKEATNV